MLIRPAIGDTDPIRYRRPTPDGQFSGNIIDEAMRNQAPGVTVGSRWGVKRHADSQSDDISEALDDMLFAGGKLNVKLLGGAQEMVDR
jgi:hypothetical protein